MLLGKMRARCRVAVQEALLFWEFSRVFYVVFFRINPQRISVRAGVGCLWYGREVGWGCCSCMGVERGRVIIDKDVGSFSSAAPGWPGIIP